MQQPNFGASRTLVSARVCCISRWHSFSIQIRTTSRKYTAQRYSRRSSLDGPYQQDLKRQLARQVPPVVSTLLPRLELRCWMAVVLAPSLERPTPRVPKRCPKKQHSWQWRNCTKKRVRNNRRCRFHGGTLWYHFLCAYWQGGATGATWWRLPCRVDVGTVLLWLVLVAVLVYFEGRERYVGKQDSGTPTLVGC